MEAKPFGSEKPSVTMRVKARKFDEWKKIDGNAAAPALSPVDSTSEEEELVLVPYAAAKLRVTAFPSLLS
jgi:uncharacterized protein